MEAAGRPALSPAGPLPRAAPGADSVGEAAAPAPPPPAAGTSPPASARPSPETLSSAPGPGAQWPGGGGWAWRGRSRSPGPGEGRPAARQPPAPNRLVASRRSLQPRAQRGQPPPGPAPQTGRKAAQRFERTRRSGSRRPLGRRGKPWGGGSRGEARARSPSGPQGAAPIATPRPPAAAREPQRASPHVGPHGLVPPAPDWSPSGQSEVTFRGGRTDWPPRAGRGRGRGSLLFFLPPRRAPHLPLPASRDPHPEPGPGRRGCGGGRRLPPDAPPKWPRGGPGFAPAPGLFTRKRKTRRLTRGLCGA